MVERPIEMRGCKSPTHEPGCPCTMCNKPVENCKKCPELSDQHIIPLSIGKAIGMTRKQLEAPENHRRESKVDHRPNDARVPKVLYEMKKEMKEDKMKFSIAAVKSMRDNYYFHA